MARTRHRTNTRKPASSPTGPEPAPGIPLPADPLERLRAIRDGWLDLAAGRLARLVDPGGRVSTQDAVQAGIASQRAVEIQRHLDAHAARAPLPLDLPDGDEERRRVVLQAWWSAARAGSPTASRYLAQALGVRDARQQTIELVWGDQLPQLPGGADGSTERDDDEPAPSSLFDISEDPEPV
jgi:hypothetical protein